MFSGQKLSRNLHEEDLSKTLWRYMDFTKFIDLIENSTIFFPRVDLFEDKFEGVHNVVETDMPLPVNPDEIPVMQFEQYKQWQMLKAANKDITKARDCFGVSCWRLGKDESHAMWKIFLSSNEGIAIKTTVGKLKDNIILENDQALVLGPVDYIDFKKQPISFKTPFEALFHKSNYFEHEKEFRVIVGNSPQVPVPGVESYFSFSTFDEKTKGIVVNINFRDIIEKIIVGPYAPEWFFNLVKKISETKYGLSVEVEKSYIGLRNY